ncbi:LysM peptidoglycan-binding domain-containing protein [Enterococcus gallinarum]|uniref:LysM peptidoglycan-binding domain-containing protein n=2 Tax=Enterococcus TaxID=1350 RepID=A0AAE4HW14_ENTGA|nr:LysM peptidoglycan-binding domain-containing protein [Enterococcus faecalis]MDT2316431.1 LysM peptidoglycan-binding domain-containing protein [Enterococcus faecium]MDT2381639.1 LysM peptidoglycan-binding domain-containing protein [Enterococcus avium]MDT2686397.1 LysM peptidoglycan-binding domain-containing protein [Enterococcus gallinarum]MDT2692129.1 LysM peptidoglycan-binding domain-containing protein [Enterococcus gallinarum]WGS34251.1 LysM peptidoglycan-binding domain-containing protein
MLLSMIVGAAAGVVFVTGGSEAHASETDGIWIPRTVDQIKADIAKSQGNKYTIVWGDTLSGISQATNITIQKLAELNKIANVDLIYAGNTLTFDGNVVTATNAKGETLVQSIVTDQEKNDVTKPVGNTSGTATTQETQNQSENPTVKNENPTTQGTPSASNVGSQIEEATPKVNTSEQNTSQSNENSTPDRTVGETNTETPATETPATETNQSGETQKTNQPTQSVTDNGTTNTSETGNYGVIDSSLPEDLTPDPVTIGNSGMLFDSLDEAMSYGWKEIKDEGSKWYGMRFGGGEVANKAGIPIGKWTVDFHEAGDVANAGENN